MSYFLGTLFLLGAALFLGLSLAVDTAGYGVLFGDVLAGRLPDFLHVPFIVALAITLAKALFCILFAWTKVKDERPPRFSIWCLRLLTIALSLLVSLLVFSENLLSPRAAQLLEVERKLVRQKSLEAERDIEIWEFQEIGKLDRRLATVQTKLEQFYMPRIQTAEAGRTKEMEIGGQSFKGNRYTEYQVQISDLQVEWDAKLQQANLSYDTETEDVRGKAASQINMISADTKSRLSGLSLAQFQDTEDAQNPNLVRLSQVFDKIGLGDYVTPQLVGIAVAVMATLAVEFIPLLLLTHALLFFLTPKTKELQHSTRVTNVSLHSRRQTLAKEHELAA